MVTLWARVACMCVVLGGLAVLTAEEEEKPKKPEMEVSCFSGVSIGKIIDGYSSSSVTRPTGEGDLKSKWFQSWELWLTSKVDFTERINAEFSGGGAIGYDLHAQPGQSALRRVKGSFFGITQTQLNFKVGNIENPPLVVSAGYFPFKYSPDAKNLGEYLFRSECYPSLLFTYGLNNAQRSLLGIRLHNSLLDEAIKQDLLFTSEDFLPPLFDYSVSYVGSFNLKKIAEVGIGASLWRILPVNNEKTTPGKDTLNALNPTLWEKMVYINPSDSSDTSFYTFRGVKLMARLSFDIKKLIPVDIWGEEDLKLYGEWAWLGVKDFPKYYEDPIKRMPMMVGFNIPTFKLLKVLAVEFEYFQWPYTNSTFEMYTSGTPVPEDISLLPADKVKEYEEFDNLKWTVYFKRELFKKFVVSGQFAKDHIRLPDKDGVPDFSVNYVKPEHWYWVVQVGYFF